MVGVVAEAGVGKSRLFYEFKLRNQNGWMVLEAYSVSHGKASAYLPVIELLHGYFGIDAGDDARQRREKVAGKIAILDRALEDTLPYLFGLLGIADGEDPLAGMDAQIRKRRTLEAIKRILLRESLNQPLMVMFEDLHWIDQETQALLNLLADSIGTSRILLLVNYRPEYRHDWGNQASYTQLRLHPLGRASAEEMLTALLGEASEVAPLKQLIIERTEGTPFFMEEMVQTLFEDGTLIRNGQTRMARSLRQLRIPATVQAVLAARIDRLAPAEKDLLQTLAVIGTEFPLSLVRAVAVRSDDELERGLEHLQLAEFIYEQPAVGEVEYTFKHALTHDVAYNSLLHERRNALHERVAQAMEKLYAERLEDRFAELARHYSRSQNLPKAAHYLTMAGQQANSQRNYTEALSYLEAAAQFLARLPEGRERDRSEIAVLQMLGESQLALGRYDHAGKAYERTLDLANRIGDAPSIFRALLGAFLYGNREQAGAYAEQMVALAERTSDRVMLAEASVWRGVVMVETGEDLATARRLLERGNEILELLPPQTRFYYMDNRVSVWQPLAFALALLGFPDSALQFAERFLQAPQSTARFWSACILGIAELYRRFGDPDRVRELTEPIIALYAPTTARGESAIFASAIFLHGWALASLGRIDEGIAELTPYVSVFTAGVFVPETRGLNLAEVYGKAGKPEKGIDIVDQLLTGKFINWRSNCRQADAHRVRGKLLLELDPPRKAEAEQSLRQAIVKARECGAKGIELPATTSLARLLRDTNQRDEARAMLADIYNWFTEGFDTADLKDARALLEELGDRPAS